MNDLYEILTREISDVQALENLANIVIRATEKTNLAGKRHPQRYAGSQDEIAGAARQLAEMVLQAVGQSNTGLQSDLGWVCGECEFTNLEVDTVCQLCTAAKPQAAKA